MSAVQTLFLVTGIVIFNLIACSPVFVSAPIRRLFNRPFENLFLNFLVATTIYSAVHSLLLMAVVVLAEGFSGIAVLQALALITSGTAVFAWLIASLILPHLDYWDPKQTDEELDGRIALGIGVLWYIISAGAALFLLLVASIALFFPG